MSNIKNNTKIFVIGITGGIGSGKTTVANLLVESGAIVLFTDDIAKELMEKEQSLKNKIIKEFGPDTFDSAGNLNRSFIAAIVFGTSEVSKKKQDILNCLVHPHVINFLIKKIDKLAREGKKIIFVESALIYETSLEGGFDYIILVDAEKEKCIERTTSKMNISKKEVEKRLKSQMPSHEKRAAADFVIENNGTFDELKKSVETIYIIIKSLCD